MPSISARMSHLGSPNCGSCLCLEMKGVETVEELTRVICLLVKTEMRIVNNGQGIYENNRCKGDDRHDARTEWDDVRSAVQEE